MKERWRLNIWLLLAGVGLMLVAACSQSGPSSSSWPGLDEESRSTRTRPIVTLPPPPLTATPTPQPSIESPPTEEVVTIWIDPAVPYEVQLPPQIQEVPQRADAMVRLEIGSSSPVSEWIYALAAPFYEIRDGVASTDLLSKWRGEPAGRLAGVSLLLSQRTLAAFSEVWGEPAAGVVQVVPPTELLAPAWASPSTWAIIPFEQLRPRWKVLAVDGQSPLDHGFESADYALKVDISLTGDPDSLAAFARDAAGSETPAVPAGNRDPDKLTMVAMTGVTALVRATAWTMEQRGVTYPAADVGPWLREADITHISNEVPFAEGCPFPNPAQQGVVFCSDSRYIELLDAVGTDVVELTGDHFHDWGAEAMLYTLSLYEERGWLTYGGGETYDAGRQPVTLEHNGNRLAFIGCNGKGGSFARASASSPGSVACDMSWLQQAIADLNERGYLVIATFQHQEHYGYAVPSGMAADFQAAADAGAVVVSGSQAHHPHGFEFRGDSLIHFGLGNLFFDQYDISPGTRQSFIDRHIFYDGRYISTELLTFVFVDYARSRPMNEGEREALLRSAFAASGW